MLSGSEVKRLRKSHNGPQKQPVRPGAITCAHTVRFLEFSNALGFSSILEIAKLWENAPNASTCKDEDPN